MGWKAQLSQSGFNPLLYIQNIYHTLPYSYANWMFLVNISGENIWSNNLFIS